MLIVADETGSGDFLAVAGGEDRPQAALRLRGLHTTLLLVGYDASEAKVAIRNGTWVNPRAKQPPAPPVVDDAPTFETLAGYYRKQRVEERLADTAGDYHDGVVRFLGRVNRVKLQEIDLHFHDLRHEAGAGNWKTVGRCTP